MRRVCLGRLSYGSYNKLWQSLRPPHKSGSRYKTTDFDAVKYFTWFSTPGGHLARDVNIPKAHSRGGMSAYGAFFACLSHPLPKSKWHVPPPANGFAHGFYSHLRQSLCPPKGSKPSVRYGLPLSDSGYRRAVLMFLGG